MIGVVIPWRETSHDRAEAKEFVEARLRLMLPGAEVFLADTNHPTFNLAGSRNAGVKLAEEAGCEVVVVCDADSIPERDPVVRAISQSVDGRMHLPYTRFISLSDRGTFQYRTGRPVERCQKLLDWEESVGGVYVSTVAAWWRTGGQDERFLTWGCEDVAFKAACDNRLGPTVRHRGSLVHLHHRAQREITPESLELLAEYL